MPTAVTKKGTTIPQLQSESWEFDPTRGYFHRQIWRGASQLQMLALQQNYVRNSIACKLDYNQGDTATLDIADSSQQYVIDCWELAGNDVSRDIFSHPTMLGIPADVIATVRACLDANITPANAFLPGSPIEGGVDISDYITGPLPDFYELYQRGSTDYLRPQYVLRHRTNAPNNWTVNISDFGISQIYTPAQLLTEISSRALWVFPCPLRLRYKIAKMDYGTNGPLSWYVPPFRSGYQWGWLKSSSVEVTAANNRVDIIQEYTLEQWSTSLYAPY